MVVYEGYVITFTATPADGYKFTAWTNGTDTVSVANPYTVTIEESIALVANFDRDPKLDRSNWTITASSQEATGEGAGNGVATCIIDGQSNTFWHSQWQGSEPGYPHWFMIDMQESKAFNSFEYVSRGTSTSGAGANNGNILNYTLYVSDTEIDPTALDAAVKVTEGQFTYDGTTNVHKVEFNSVKARYVMLYATGQSANGNKNASCVEFYLYSKAYSVTVSSSNPAQGTAYIGEEGITSADCSIEGTDVVTITAVPAEGYKFVNWTVNGEVVSTENPYTATVTADTEFVANFANKYTQLTTVPTIYINTENGVGVTSKDNYVTAYVTVRGAANEEDNITEVLTEIKGRGNSTWGMAKKPYRLKFDEKIKFLGNEAKEKNWVLLANYADKTLMRNALAFETSRNMFDFGFTPSVTFVDVVLNGENLGSYMLTDQVEVKKKRVPVTEQDETTTSADPEITGGYLIEVDGFANQEISWFQTTKGMKVTIKYPKDDEINSDQSNYISNYTQQMENTLFSSNYTDAETGWRKYIDAASMVDWYIACELFGNSDAWWSTYMYKERDDVFKFGPLWDFDIAFNNDSRLGDATQKLMRTYAHDPKTWIARWWQDAGFQANVEARWAELRKAGVADFMTNYIDSTAAYLNLSQQNNFQRWNILNTVVYNELAARGSYEAEVAFLKNYVNSRIQFLDTQFSLPQMFDVTVSSSNPTMGSVATNSIHAFANDQVTLTATPNEGYKFVNWTVNGEVVSDEATFVTTVTANTEFVANFDVILSEPTGTENGYGYVDLGLPSGIKWATYNVGATSPEEYGDYFAWGETEPKDYYWNSSYKWGNGKATKYCTDSDDGVVDNKTILELEDDAAYANWGGNWRMPTEEEIVELVYTNNCTWEWITKNGVNGYKVTSKVNGNSIFLPAAGFRTTGSFEEVGSYGCYWSSSLNTSINYSAMELLFNSSKKELSFGGRCEGRSVRAVYAPITTYTITVSTADATMGSVVASATEVKDGGTVTLTATPNYGYKFTNWTLGGEVVSTDNPYQVTITQNSNFVANFEELENKEVTEDEVIDKDETLGEVEIAPTPTPEPGEGEVEDNKEIILDVNTHIFQAETITININKDGKTPQISISVGGEVITKNIKVIRNIKGGIWTMLSLPFDIEISDILVENAEVEIDSNLLVRIYDAAYRAANSVDGKTANGWKEKTSGTIPANPGFAVAINSRYDGDVQEVTFLGRDFAMDGTDKELTLNR
ncbi:MAG: CotH kinase family protein, partial [Paludibacteraceae bacterium]|nr:CotH kinase family protein [Paludibacteraceae bacterium]